MKEHLKENCSVLVFKSDNENFVDFVNVKFPLDYSYYGYSFNDMLDVGCLAKYPGFNSFDEYVNYEKEIIINRLNKIKEEITSDEYYAKTEPLAKLYYEYSKKYYFEKEKITSHYKKFEKSEVGRNFNDFFKKYPELVTGDRFYLDPRFHCQSIEKTKIMNGEEVKIISVSYSKLYTKEEFLKEVENNYLNYLNSYFGENGVYQIFYQNATMDLKDLKIKVKELLKTHKQVGLIGAHAEGNLKEINDLSIDEFSLMDYLKVQPKCIYWFIK